MKSKTLFIFLIFVCISIQNLNAQEKTEVKEYYQKMKSNIYTLYKANSLQTFKLMSGRFEEIAKKEETKWIPYYHAAYAYIMASYLSKEKFEAEEFLNKGQLMIDRANELHPHHSEIVALQGFLYQARIGVNPEARTRKYLPMAVKEYDQARFLNKDNPRPYYLIGQILYKIPKELGGNKGNACKHFEKAAERFETFKPRSEFSPNWGKESNLLMLNKCK